MLTLFPYAAVVLSNNLIRRYLINYARPLIYSTVINSLNIAAISCAVKYSRRHGQQQRQALDRLIQHCLRGLATLPLPSKASLKALIAKDSTAVALRSPIIPILTEDAKALSHYLQSNGFLVRAVTYPTVPLGHARIRICLHAGNTIDEVERLISAIRSWYDRGTSAPRSTSRTSELSLAKL